MDETLLAREKTPAPTQFLMRFVDETTSVDLLAGRVSSFASCWRIIITLGTLQRECNAFDGIIKVDLADVMATKAPNQSIT